MLINTITAMPRIKITVVFGVSFSLNIKIPNNVVINYNSKRFLVYTVLKLYNFISVLIHRAIPIQVYR